jgi:hypothetical protein
LSSDFEAFGYSNRLLRGLQAGLADSSWKLRKVSALDLSEHLANFPFHRSRNTMHVIVTKIVNSVLEAIFSEMQECWGKRNLSFV